MNSEEQFQGVVQEIRDCGFTVAEVINPGVRPPRDEFSDTVHDQFGRYINALFDWKDENLKKRQLSSEGWWWGVRNIQDSFQSYLDERDPLLFPALVHLIHEAFHGDKPVSQDEKTYLTLRTKALNQILRPIAMESLDWDEAYERLAYVLGVRDKESELIFKATDDIGLRKEIRKAFKDKAEKEGTTAAKEDRDFVYRHYQDRTYPEKAKLKITSGLYAGASENIGLRTAWVAWDSFGKQEMSAPEGVQPVDSLLIPHVSFIYRMIQDGGYYTFPQKVLGLAWLHQTAIECKKASQADVDVWLAKIKDCALLQLEHETDLPDVAPSDEERETPAKKYKFTEDYDDTASHLSTDTLSPYQPRSPSVRRSNVGIVYGAASDGPNPPPPKLYLSPVQSPSINQSSGKSNIELTEAGGIPHASRAVSSGITVSSTTMEPLSIVPPVHRVPSKISPTGGQRKPVPTSPIVYSHVASDNPVQSNPYMQQSSLLLPFSYYYDVHENPLGNK
ncbi:hypothetical protein E1189_08970 [Sansalvadorimonas verongulae]|nr:hypothetical protein [Sansalvadorimonas verongulae]